MLLASDSIALDPMAYGIKPFPFGPTSQGTPTWLDGFVIPAGKLAAKKEGIALFLQYITASSTYQLVHKAQKSRPGRYLLPSYRSAFEQLGQDSPLMHQFLATQNQPFLINNPDLHQGMRTAGAALQQQLTKASKAPISQQKRGAGSR